MKSQILKMRFYKLKSEFRSRNKIQIILKNVQQMILLKIFRNNKNINNLILY